VAAAEVMRAVAASAGDQLAPYLQVLYDHREALGESDPAIVGGLLRALHTLTIQSDAPVAAIRQVPALQFPPIIAALPEAAPNRHLLMHLLSLARSGDHLAVLAEILIARPPSGWMAVGQVLSPLMQYDDWDPHDFFPAVLQALPHPSVAAPLLDVANYVTRQGRVPRHPATDRLEALLQLFGGVIGRLGKFEADPKAFGETVEAVQAVLGEAVALSVSLCDAFGLIGDPRAIGKLNQALALTHRRVQTEAAGALARLGDEAGKERLLELVEEPSARLRVLAYADELGWADAIDPQYRSEESIAKAELAVWLAQPQNFGLPPSQLEVVDSRRQFWPSYPEPVDCHLVEFAYAFGETDYRNVGITGPTVHVFAADLMPLAPEDVYACYAGWHAEHPDIFTVPADQWNAAQRRLAAPLIEHLERSGFEAIEAGLLGFMLDEHAVACLATRDDQRYAVVTDGLETVEVSTANRARPFEPTDIWHLYLGRKILRTFNP
jgi:hypothetical protein